MPWLPVAAFSASSSFPIRANCPGPRKAARRSAEEASLIAFQSAATVSTPPPPPPRPSGEGGFGTKLTKEERERQEREERERNGVAEDAGSGKGDGEEDPGVYTVNGITYLDGKVHEAKLKKNTPCQVWLEDREEWYDGVIVTVKETAVPNTDLKVP